MSRLFTPRPYQKLIMALEHSLDRKSVFAGMGLGKTVSTLNAIDANFLAGENEPVLVLAPKRVAASTWPDEVKKWLHLNHIEVQPILGDANERRRALLNTNAAVFTMNYENLPWLVDYLAGRWPFAHVVADESTRLKNFRLKQGGVRARALGSIAHTKIKRWTNLSGTPSPNGLQDLWGQMWFVDAGARLGRTYTAFEQRWFAPKPDGFGTRALPTANEQIQAAIRDVCLSVDAADWFDIREPIVNDVYVDLPKKARALYDDMEKHMYFELEGSEIEAFGAAARTMKCLQLANGAVYAGDDTSKWLEVHDEKITALESIINEAGGAPILVAYHFKSDLARLRKAFPSSRVLDDNPATISDWNAGRVNLLLAHPQSAGHGLNLQDGGNILVFFGNTWNLEHHDQIIERIGPTRQMQAGHNRPVFIYYIMARRTVDVMVRARLASKRSIQDILMEALKHRREEYESK